MRVHTHVVRIKLVNTLVDGIWIWPASSEPARSPILWSVLIPLATPQELPHQTLDHAPWSVQTTLLAPALGWLQTRASFPNLKHSKAMHLAENANGLTEQLSFQDCLFIHVGLVLMHPTESFGISKTDFPEPMSLSFLLFAIVLQLSCLFIKGLAMENSHCQIPFLSVLFLQNSLS